MLNVTQGQLANQVKIIRQTIIAIEKERYELTIGVALLIANSLNDTVENLFYFEKE